MAKKPETKTAPKGKTNLPARVTDNGSSVPAHLRGYESKGVGVPTRPEDFLLPIAKVLGPQSPEVLRGNAAQVKGAEPGDILIKNAPNPLIKAADGFLFQPCHISQAVVEWLPRGKGGGGGAGYVARHPEGYINDNPEEVKKVKDPQNKDKDIWVRKATGNHLVETRYYAGYMISDDLPPMQLVLPFSSTGHTVAKDWNNKIAAQRLGDGPADLWLVYYHIGTKLRQRGDQSWYLFDPQNAGKDGRALWVPETSDVERGLALHQALARGEKQIGDEEENSDAGAGSDDRM